MEPNPYESPKVASGGTATGDGHHEPLFFLVTALAAGLAGMVAAAIVVVALHFSFAGG